MTEQAHHFAGQSRCSNCLSWGENMPFTYTMLKPAGGKHVRNFCCKRCRVAWCFRHRIVPMDMLPPEMIQDMREQLLAAV